MLKFAISLCLVVFASAATTGNLNVKDILHSALLSIKPPPLKSIIETRRYDAVSDIMEIYDQIIGSIDERVIEIHDAFRNDTQQFHKLNKDTAASGVSAEYTNLPLDLSAILEAAINNITECATPDIELLYDYFTKINSSATHGFEGLRNATENARECRANIQQGNVEESIDLIEVNRCLDEEESSTHRIFYTHAKDILLTVGAAKKTYYIPTERMKPCVSEAYGSFRTALEDKINKINQGLDTSIILTSTVLPP